MRVLFGEQWAYAWPVLGLLALSKGILTPCSTFIPYLKGIGYGGTLFWWAILRAIITTAAVAYGAITGGLVDAMIWLCIVNAVVLFGYSWVVFRADDMPFLKGFFLCCRPMLTAAIMAIVVRLLLNRYGTFVPNQILQLLAGAAIGGVLYAVFVMLTERALLAKLFEFIRRRRSPIAEPAAE